MLPCTLRSPRRFLIERFLRPSFFCSCFVTSQDNYTWQLVFFFIPIGIALCSGLLCFLFSLYRITYLRVRRGLLVVVYLRVLCFVATFFLVFAGFVLYSLAYALKRGDIEGWYEEYFGCLTGTSKPLPSACDSVFPPMAFGFPLVMLRGFALACVGTLLFFNFFSREMVHYWFTVFYDLCGGRSDDDNHEVHNYDKCIHLVANVVNE